MKSSSVCPPSAAAPTPGRADFDFAAPPPGRASAPPFSNVLARAVTPPRPHQPAAATQRAAPPKPPGLNQAAPAAPTAPTAAPDQPESDPEATASENPDPNLEAEVAPPPPATLAEALAVLPSLVPPTFDSAPGTTVAEATPEEVRPGANAGQPLQLAGNTPAAPSPGLNLSGWLTTATQITPATEIDLPSSPTAAATTAATSESASGLPPTGTATESSLTTAASLPQLTPGATPQPRTDTLSPTLETAAPAPENNPKTAAPDDATPELTTAPGTTEVTDEATTPAAVVTEFAPPPETARRLARAARRAWADALENARGIGGAKSTETMKNMVKQEKVAGLGEQILPGMADFSTPGLGAGSQPNRLGAKAEPASAEALLAASKLGAAASRADLSELAHEADLPAPATLQRLNEVITREVKMFKRAGDDLVEVILTPDAKTQISLKLQWRDGQVEVQARCDLGDHRSLNSQWGQLQAAMAQQGVRLSHLSERTTTGFTEFFQHGTFSQHSGGDHRSDQRAPEAPAISAALPNAPAATPARGAARRQRLLESWA